MLPKPFRQCPLSLLKTPDPLGIRVENKYSPSAEVFRLKTVRPLDAYSLKVFSLTAWGLLGVPKVALAFYWNKTCRCNTMHIFVDKINQR